MNNFQCFPIQTGGPVFYRFMKNPIWTLNKRRQLYELACLHDNAENNHHLIIYSLNIVFLSVLKKIIILHVFKLPHETPCF